MNYVFSESGVNTTLLVLGISNIVFLSLVVFLAIKLCQNQNKGKVSFYHTLITHIKYLY